LKGGRLVDLGNHLNASELLERWWTVVQPLSTALQPEIRDCIPRMPRQNPQMTKKQEGTAIRPASKMGSEESFVLNDAGEKEDAALHETLLDSAMGNARADLIAVAHAIERGLPLADAIRMYAGDEARALLRLKGLI